MNFMLTLRTITCIICLCISTNCLLAQQHVLSQIEQAAATLKAQIGVNAIILETGDTINFHEEQRFPMQSTYKFPIAMSILHKVDQGKLTLKQKIAINPSEIIPRGVSLIREKYPQGTTLDLNELLRLNVAESDGTACDVLIRLAGGTQKVQEYINSIGIKNMRIATTEMVQVSDDWIQYQNWSTPKAMTELLKIFYEGDVLSKNSQSKLLEWMIASVPGNKRLKGSLPPNAVVAHKPGTSGTFRGLTRATNDIGIITLPNGNHVAISVFVSDAYGTTPEREGIIAAITKIIWDYAGSK
ncbi:MAG: class A beta-lactamase [Candidatus Pedobacter colombiensis]|uniref:Beta-lactamase n=1 Tax=Candidatus Pedobacter colombiensis TaxID=3121371 RepID=A0AAJ5W873_9SPHI|nr:class A beta-lactamase [Pedobacter sp.]WEK18973.1 MAG: class A beta-lactamase [Pedobacter sp.]